MAISIDWGTKIITVPKTDLTLVQSTPTTIYDMDINWFRLELKSLEDSEEGIPHLDTHTHNTEVTLGGLTFSRVVEIINGYTITFEDDQYAVNLTGANSNIGDNVNVNQVSVRSQNSAGLISSPAIEYASFNGGVIVDVNSGISGTIFPRGTEQMKVNNIADALLIANYRGFSKIYLHSDITLGSDAALDNFVVVGQSNISTNVTFEDGAAVENTIIVECGIQGVLDGNNTVTKCIVGDITYLNGHIHNSALIGTLQLDGNKDAFLVNCNMSDWDYIPEIDMGSAGQDLIIAKYTGKILVSNMSGSNRVGIGLDGGIVVLDSLTVTSGVVHVSGIGRLVDDNDQHISSGTWNTGVTIINDLVTTDTIAISGEIAIDEVNGSSGTSYPIGCESSPVNNISDAIAISGFYGISIFRIKGSLTVDGGEDISNFTLIANRSVGNIVTITNAVTDNTYFENLTINGTMNGTVRFTTCVMGTITNFGGGAKNCLLTGDLNLTGTGSNYLTDCDTYITDSSTFKKITISDKRLNIIRCRGNYEIAGKTSTDTTAIDLVAGTVQIDSDCISGEIFMDGIVHTIDNSSTGCTVITTNAIDNELIVDAVWDEITADHISSGTFGEMFDRIDKTTGDNQGLILSK